MTTLSLRLPNSLHETAKSLAEREDVSLNQLISMALAEKVSVLGAEEILGERAARGDRAKFLSALDKAPDVEEDAEEWNPKSVDEVIGNQRGPVRSFVRELMKSLKGNDDFVEVYTTNTAGGDVRFRHANGIYAEIKFLRRKDAVDLHLYFEPDVNPGNGFRLFQRTNKQSKYDIRLDALKPVPERLKVLIEKSRTFMRSKR